MSTDTTQTNDDTAETSDAQSNVTPETSAEAAIDTVSQAVEEAIDQSPETGNSTSQEAASNVEVSLPEFAQLVDSGAKHSNNSIGRFRDIRVKVTAEIGNVSMPIGEILELAEGSVIELDKPTNAPIDLMAQGVRIAQGEVVVVDDCFAIRIKEIETPQED